MNSNDSESPDMIALCSALSMPSMSSPHDTATGGNVQVQKGITSMGFLCNFCRNRVRGTENGRGSSQVSKRLFHHAHSVLISFQEESGKAFCVGELWFQSPSTDHGSVRDFAQKTITSAYTQLCRAGGRASRATMNARAKAAERETPA